MADPCSPPKQAPTPGHRESVIPLSPRPDLQVNGIKTLGPKGTYKMSCGSVTFQYFLDFGGGGVGKGKLSLAGVLFLLEFGTSSAGYSESQDNVVFQPSKFWAPLAARWHNAFTEKQQLRPRMCWLFTRALCFNYGGDLLAH